MESLINNFRILIFAISVIFSGCISKKNIECGGYRYTSLEKVPRGKMGILTGKAYWNLPHHIAGPTADSFYVYGHFDSILFKGPASSSMYRKTDIRAASWKAKPSYGNLYFVGNFKAAHLPGLYVSYYFSKDRRNILQALYTNPGTLVDAALFHKDSVNVLKKQGIVVEPSQ